MTLVTLMETDKFNTGHLVVVILIIIISTFFLFFIKNISNSVGILIFVVFFGISIYDTSKRNERCKSIANELRLQYKNSFFISPHIKGQYKNYFIRINYPGPRGTYGGNIGLWNITTSIRIYDKKSINYWIIIKTGKTIGKKRPISTKIPAFYENYDIRTNNTKAIDNIIDDKIKLEILEGEFRRIPSTFRESPYHYIKIDKNGIELFVWAEVSKKEIFISLLDYLIKLNKLLSQNFKTTT